MDKNLKIFEKVLLLGLLPLLGGTETLIQALLITVSTIIISIIIFALSNIIHEANKWYWEVAIAITLSYSLYLILPKVVPVADNIINHYFLFLGVTPIVYLGATANHRKDLFPYLSKFILFMIIAASIREFLGLGSIFNIQLTNPAYPPLGIINKFPGAILVISVIWLLSNLITSNKNLKKEGSESLV